jgi:hypothetical protein
MIVKYDYRQVYLSFAYSLAYVDREDEVRTYSPHFDRRHNINMVAAYTFGKDERWEINGRWNFGSGFPFTQTQGHYEKLDFGTNINTDIASQNGTLSQIYAELNNGRLPYYHRLDIGASRKWILSKYATFEANVGATNVYNRENIFYFNRITYSSKNQLPVLPTIGVSLTF